MATYRPVKTYQRLWRRKIYKRRATLPAHIVDCRECGLRNHIPQLSQGQEAACSRCGHELVRVESNPYIAPLAYTTTTLILLAIVYSQMFLTIEMPGVYSRLTLPGMMKILIVQDWGFLAEVMFIFIFNGYSSGLNYYYFISGLIGILTMVFLRKTTDEKKLLAQLEANKEKKKQKKRNLVFLQKMKR